MTVTIKQVMALEDISPDEATHGKAISFTGKELGSVTTAVYILAGKEYPTQATPVPNEPTKATATVPNTWLVGSGQVFLKGSRDRQTNTMPFDVIPG
ncbi:hypothetical protein [Streptomyces pinistramenti]|uniref:hypothetical protein n=1 Tax=Streptomyces pinistramenti TaxID=2884812 RepID=UPI001D06A41B|nr:hypothetical protein [Streptomyces pinistramenti]MCB5912331.1 hypothetical protein [Streptomyces pinistramenti]